MKTDNKNIENKNIVERKEPNKVANSRIKDYFGYIKYMQNNGWIREYVTLHENLSTIATINSLKANNGGIVIDVKCPPGYRMSIMGKDSVPEEYNIVHYFETMFKNSDGIEINCDTRIIFTIDKVTKKNIQIDTVLYSDISSTNFEDTPNKFKDYQKLFRFDDGIEIKEEEHLRIYVIDPDLDITEVKFSLGVDLLIQKE